MMADKVGVSERALIQRINRKLPNQIVRSNQRSTRNAARLGRHYIVDLQRKEIVAHHIDLIALAKQVNAIEPWEELEDE